MGLGFVVVLAVGFVAIIVHEWGHYKVAKWMGMSVDMFMIGFGPALLRWRNADGTEFSIRPFPIGGAVSIPDVDKAPRYARVLMILAGPAMNLLVVAVPLLLLGLWALLWGDAHLMALVLKGFKAFIALPMMLAEATWNMLTLPWGAAYWTQLANQGGMVAVGHVVEQNIMLGRDIWVGLIVVFVVLNMAIGVVNLVPLPPLDGGRLLLEALGLVLPTRVADKVGYGLSVVGGVYLVIVLILPPFVADIWMFVKWVFHL